MAPFEFPGSRPRPRVRLRRTCRERLLTPRKCNATKAVAVAFLPLVLLSPATGAAWRQNLRRPAIAERRLLAAGPGRPGASCGTVSSLAALAVGHAAVAAAPSIPGLLLEDESSNYTEEALLKLHAEVPVGQALVQSVSEGVDGIWAARGTLVVPAPAEEIFARLTDPDENVRIFARNVVALNYRNLLEEDSTAGTRLFEVSKTGCWRLLGLPFSFESTVFAVEDWRGLEIRFWLKRPGAMQHLSGFWRVVPISPRESLVVFYNEAVPRFHMPKIFHAFARRFLEQMCSSVLEDLGKAATGWRERFVSHDKPRWAAQVLPIDGSAS